MRRLGLLHSLVLAILQTAFLSAAPVARYANPFDDAAALDGLETSSGAPGGSVTIENGRLALRGAPFSYRGARVAVPLSLVLGRTGPFTARDVARSRISWSFNLSYENGPGGATNTGFRVYPLSTSATPDTEAAASYSLRGGIYADDRVAFHQASSASAEAVPFEPPAEGAVSLPPLPAMGAMRVDLDLYDSSSRWVVRLHRGDGALDPEKLPLNAPIRAHGEYFANTHAFTHLVFEGQNGGAVWIDNLVVSTYDDFAADTRGPDQIIPTPAGIDAPHTFGDAPVPLPATASSGLPVSWAVMGAGRIENGMLHFTGAGWVYLYGQQAGDSVYRSAVSQHFFSVAPRAIDIQLSGLRQTYAGAPRSIVATTTPADVPLRITYDGSETPPSHAGTYQIAVSPTSTDYVGGTTGVLTVNRALLTARPAPVSRLVGHPNPNPHPVLYEGFVGSDTVTALDEPPAARTSANRSSRPGDYAVTLVGGSDNDYRFALRSGILTVIAYSGTYEALLTPPGQPAAAPLGKLVVTLSGTRPEFSGTLRISGETFARAFTGTLGKLQPDGFVPASFFLARPLGSSAQHLLELKLDATRLQASLSRGPDVPSLSLFATSDEGAKRHVPAPAANSPWKGRHTLLLRPQAPSGPEALPAPRGPGHATGVIAAPSGLLTLSGRLPDGVAFTSSSLPDEAGRHRVFVHPHGSARPNTLVGRLDLLPHPSLAGRHHVPAGQQSLFWSRAPISSPGAGTLYPAGYSSLPLSVWLDPWLAPAPAKRATAQAPAQPAITLVHRLGIRGDPATLDILYPESSDFGPAAVQLPTAFAFGSTGKPLAPSPNPSRWTIGFDPVRGTMSGSFVLRYPPTPPAIKETTQTITFSGVLRQPAAEDDTLVGAARFIWTDSLHGLPRASDEILFTRPTPEPEPAPAP